MTYKNDDELKREILDAMVTCEGRVSRVAAQCHVNASTIFRWIAQSEISPESNKLDWAENGTKPLHVHAKLARRMGRLIARSDYFDDETPQPEKPTPFVDDAEEIVDEAAKHQRGLNDAMRGPELHPPRRSHERMLEDRGVNIRGDINWAKLERANQGIDAERAAAAKVEVVDDVGDLTTLPAPPATSDGRLDTLNSLLARIEARGTPATEMENDLIFRLQQPPSRPRPQAPVMVGRPEDEPASGAAFGAPTGPRRPWSPSAPAPAVRPPPREGQPLPVTVPRGKASADHDGEGIGPGHVRPGGQRMV